MKKSQTPNQARGLNLYRYLKNRPYAAYYLCAAGKLKKCPKNECYKLTPTDIGEDGKLTVVWAFDYDGGYVIRISKSDEQGMALYYKVMKPTWTVLKADSKSGYTHNPPMSLNQHCEDNGEDYELPIADESVNIEGDYEDKALRAFLIDAADGWAKLLLPVLIDGGNVKAFVRDNLGAFQKNEADIDVKRVYERVQYYINEKLPKIVSRLLQKWNKM